MRERLKLGILAALLLVLSWSVAASADINPSAFSDYTYLQNFTDGGGSPTTLNHTRGYIHEMNFNESQQTPRWKAYVGNITGELSIGDGTYSLYDWPLTTVVGELFATRYTGTVGSLRQGASVGTPIWANVACATQAAVINETSKLNHNATLDVDAMSRTFKQLGTFTNFRVGDKSVDTNNCYGAFLNQGGADQSTDWQQVVLEDSGDSANHDVMYAVQLENATAGFNNGLYDYQILLPENGAEGDQDNTAYYFYIELLGDSN